MDYNADGVKETLVASIIDSKITSPFPGDPGDIIIVDFSGNSPKLLSRIDAGQPSSSGRLPMPAEAISIVDKMMFVADGQAGCVPVDITNPWVPKIKSEYLTPDAHDLTAWKNWDGLTYVYIADKQQGLIVLTYRDSNSFVNLNNVGYYSVTGGDGTWQDIYEHEQKALVLRGRLGVVGAH